MEIDRYLALIIGRQDEVTAYYYDENCRLHSFGEIIRTCGEPHINKIEVRKVFWDYIGEDNKFEKECFKAIQVGIANKEAFDAVWKIAIRY